VTLALPIVVDDAGTPQTPVVLAVPERPVTRGDCVGGERPCPWVSCTHHALLGPLTRECGGHLDDNQALELLDRMPWSCMLDLIDERPDGLTVTPLPATLTRVPPLELDSADDHRMAMAFGLISLRVRGFTVRNPACVSKSFSNFWQVLPAFSAP
jgi:hypothetical protein